MKTILVSALALGAMTSVALATEPTSPLAGGPIDLTDAQMDGITAGQPGGGLVDVEVNRNDVAVTVPVNAGVNACAVIAACVQTTDATQTRPGRVQQ